MKVFVGALLFGSGLAGLISTFAKDDWLSILLHMLFMGMVGVGLYFLIDDIVGDRIRKHELENHDENADES